MENPQVHRHLDHLLHLLESTESLSSRVPPPFLPLGVPVLAHRPLCIPPDHKMCIEKEEQQYIVV